jgi:hypothetical protein
MNEPELGAGIDPGMAWHFHLVLRIRQDSNPKPLGRESSSLATRPDLRSSNIGRLVVFYSSISQLRGALEISKIMPDH